MLILDDCDIGVIVFVKVSIFVYEFAVKVILTALSSCL